MTHMEHIFRRKKWYYYRRRVPLEIRHYYDCETVSTSLKTDSEQLAKQRAAVFNAEVEKIWADLVLGKTTNLKEKLDTAKRIARLHGFSYLTADEVARAETSEIVNRVLSVQDDLKNQSGKVAAILGRQTEKAPTLSKSLDRYIRFNEASQFNKSKGQLKKWKNPRKLAVRNFINLHGDLPVTSITRDHILAFREWWLGRMHGEGISPESPNKDFTNLRSVLSFIRDDQLLDINLEHMFTRVRFATVKSKRPPFKSEYIQHTLLNFNNLKGLHPEAQLFLFAMADTGARPSELLGLNASLGDIRLDTDIPYIHIRPEKDKALKTAQSERQIPLVGSSLFAFQNMPKGFEHYYRKADQLSCNLNKFLRDHGLMPSEDHSIYSLRHSFEDRLTAVEPPEKVQAALMGHKYARPRYGDGPSLEQKKKWLDMICFDVSKHQIARQ